MPLYYELASIRAQLQSSASAYIKSCDAAFHQAVEAAALSAIGERRKLLMLAGPSASGKTTTARFLADVIRRKGGRAYTVSLDDFYYDNGKGPKNPDGTNDYESVDSLDIPMFCRCMMQLLDGRMTELPVFDFITGRRSEKTRSLVLAQQDCLIIEGLHALNPQITSNLPRETLFLLYISVSSRVRTGERQILSKRDTRLMRRLVRDYHFRASSPENTFALWQQVCAGETRYLFPFEENAQYKINSFLGYEPAVFAAAAPDLLRRIPAESPYYQKAQELLHALSYFEPLSSELVPGDSLLREFIG